MVQGTGPAKHIRHGSALDDSQGPECQTCAVAIVAGVTVVLALLLVLYFFIIVVVCVTVVVLALLLVL